jgi:hypothetical protein
VIIQNMPNGTLTRLNGIRPPRTSKIEQSV